METSSRPSLWLHAGMETSSNGEMRMKNSPTMHLTSNHLLHNTSSPENSPRSDRMDTSTTTMELNGKPDSRSSSQQFCLRWNNHQVSVQVAQNLSLFSAPLLHSACVRKLIFLANQCTIRIPTPIFFSSHSLVKFARCSAEEFTNSSFSSHPQWLDRITGSEKEEKLTKKK